MMPGPAVSSLAKKFDLLQDRAQRKPVRESALDLPVDAAKKASIGHLKEFYLARLAKNEPSAFARLTAKANSFGKDSVQPQAAAQKQARPTFAAGAPAVRDIEDLEIMCNNCFSLIRSSEAASCTGEPSGCPLACRSGGLPAERPTGPVALLDLKLKKLRSALEARLEETTSKVNVMRHLTQLRYHIDTAIKWTPGCCEIGALSENTVLQVRQLSATSRVLAPAVYVFSKRVENAVVQKERELRKAMLQQAPSLYRSLGSGIQLEADRDELADSVIDVKSVVSELDSDCGTQYAETVITQDGSGNDVGNVQDANEYLSLKSEDEQRRWFYSQCLNAKLACSDKTKARKILISDLYAKVKQEAIPVDGWVPWIKAQLEA